MYQHRAHSYLSALVTLVTPEKKNTRWKLRKEGRGRGGRAHRCREVKQRTRRRGAVCWPPGHCICPLKASVSCVVLGGYDVKGAHRMLAKAKASVPIPAPGNVPQHLCATFCLDLGPCMTQNHHNTVRGRGG